MRYATFSAAAILLSACASPLQEIDALEPVPLSTDQTIVIQNYVRNALKDPASANFGMIKAGKDPYGKIAVCGLVNARNSFGGYTGMAPFAGEFNSAGYFKVTGIGGEEIVSLSIRQVCARQGLAI